MLALKTDISGHMHRNAGSYQTQKKERRDSPLEPLAGS
jgi:hypothetical protein